MNSSPLFVYSLIKAWATAAQSTLKSIVWGVTQIDNFLSGQINFQV